VEWKAEEQVNLLQGLTLVPNACVRFCWSAERSRYRIRGAESSLAGLSPSALFKAL